MSEIFFAFFGAKFADILNAPCLLSSAGKVLSFLAYVCGKEEEVWTVSGALIISPFLMMKLLWHSGGCEICLFVFYFAV